MRNLLSRSIPVFLALSILACFCTSAVQSLLTRREPKVTNLVGYVKVAPSSLIADYGSDMQGDSRISPVNLSVLREIPGVEPRTLRALEEQLRNPVPYVTQGDE